MSQIRHLSVALSHTLVAFAIEYDNDWESRFWLPMEAKTLRVSMVMWENFLRFVPPQGTSLRTLSTKAGYPNGKSHPCIAGMLRWGFVTASAPPNGRRGKLDQIVRPTRAGLQAGECWAPLADEIERRWCTRFGSGNIRDLKAALVGLVDQFKTPLPRFLPVLGHLDGMRMPVPHQPDEDLAQDLSLPGLLSKAIHRYAIEFEETSVVSLAHRANVLRVLSAVPLPVRTIPARSGISKEALKMASGFLIKSGHVLEEPAATGRGKALRLTDRGMNERDRYGALHQTMEKRWENAFSHDVLSHLRSTLNALLSHDDGQESPLFAGLTAPPDTWRSTRTKRAVLPDHPMVLHRGGWPDGS